MLKKLGVLIAVTVGSLVGYKVVTDKPTRVYITEDLSPDNLKHAESLGYKKAYIVYEWTIDRDHDGVFDCLPTAHPEQCEQFLADVPKDQEILLTIDWEGKSIGDVRNGNQAAISQWILAFKYFKSALPKAKIGYYGIPMDRYYHRDIDAWKAEAKNYSTILQLVDFYAPSYYDFYPDASTPGHAEKDDLDYVQWNMERVLELPKKDIYVYVWHRYHTNGKTEEFMNVIPRQEWLSFVNKATTTKLLGRGATGIIWWGYDLGFFTYAKNPHTETLLTGECGADQAFWPSCINFLHRSFIDNSLSAVRF